MILISHIIQLFYKETVWLTAEKMIWSIFIILSILLLFRPHEDIYGGQDPGSYLNSAASYARHNSLTYIDPLLSQVDKEQRKLFFYGHKGFRQTKAACLWIKDIDTAGVGPWFQPAYPVLMASVYKISPKLILYTVPLFTILTGIALALLAGIIFSGRWIPAAAFLFYILNPNTAWHGRCPRPGIIASFLIISGLVILLTNHIEKNRHQKINILIASLAIAIAPFFHITAMFVVIPLSIFILVMILKGQTALLLYPPIMLISLITLYWQSNNITDCYHIAKAINKLPISPIWLFAFILAGIIILSLVAILIKKRFPRLQNKIPEKFVYTISMLTAIIGAILFVSIYAGIIQPGISPFSSGLLHYNIRITDIQRLVILVSRPIATVALLGWLIMLLKKDDKLPLRLVTVLILLPAAMSVGKIPNLMYYSRYMQPFLIPLLVLCITAVTSIVPQKWKMYNIATFIIMATLLASGMRHRTQLYTLVEHKGFVHSLSEIAGKIKEDNGILLCEYSRISAPFDHFFGIPTLGIDNKRQAENYRKIAGVWEKIMTNNPDSTAYFLTPFNSEMTNHLKMSNINTYTVHGKKLSTSKLIPDNIKEYTLNLKLYKVTK